MTSARIIEIGEITVGIVLPDQNGFRIFASEKRFNSLERKSFRSIDHARAAAHRLLAATQQRPPRRAA
jgi:hypothetical protein